MNTQNVGFSVSGTAQEVADALSMFGRQAGFSAPSASVPNGASVQYGTSKTTVQVEEGDTVSRLFTKAGANLGLEAGRALTFQDGNETIPGDEPAVVGGEYVAVPNHDPKGC